MNRELREEKIIEIMGISLDSIQLLEFKNKLKSMSDDEFLKEERLLLRCYGD